MYPTSVSENKARGIAAFVFVLSFVSVLLPNWLAFFFLGFLLVDFIFRAFINPKKSILFKLTEIIKIKDEKMIPSPGKRFAAIVGFSLILLSMIFIFTVPIIAKIMILTLAIFSFLESIFNFCVGCKSYWFLVKKGMLTKPNPLNPE